MADGFVPPQEVRSNAKRGLELRDKYNRGGTEVGVARARDLSNGKAISLDTINRMISYFARHEVDKKGEGWGVDSAGYIAWLLWGGDAGRSWANRIKRERENKEKSTMSNVTTAYFEITKSDRQPDGTLMVYGKATDDSLDIDQQICDPLWLDRAMPEWFKSGGNIREQHSAIAAGVAKEYEKKVDGHYIHALVVDPVSVKKVDTGVLKGFSIGIKSPRVVRDQKAANGRIIDGQIVEVSLVDRPANPNCQLVLAKSVDGESGMWKVEELVEKEAKKPNYAAINAGGGKSEPADKELYSRVKSEAKKKFAVYPSAVANAWIVREYKKRGGTYKRSSDKSVQLQNNPKENDMTTAAEIVEMAKSLATSDITKFDQKLYDDARSALAQLIVVEANEMDEGHNEEQSIAHLLSAVHHLFAWYAGEEAEGEVTEAGEDIEMSAMKDPDPDKMKDSHIKSTVGCDCAGCEKCAAAGGCSDKMCKMHDGKSMMKEPDPDKEKSADIGKCLECGCNAPGTNHGKDAIRVAGGTSGAEYSHVSTATMITPDQVAGVAFQATVTDSQAIINAQLESKSAEGEEVPAEETPAVEASEEEAPQVSDEELSEKIEAIVEKAVKSATESLKTEIANLNSAKEAAVEKAMGLETELATAKSLAVAGGPKRTIKPVDYASNDLLVKAATYKAKADASTDPDLTKGYKILAEKYFAEAAALKESN
jgi:ferredoxin